MMLSNQQFDRTRRLALSLAGIALVERHRALLAHRSRRLGIVDSVGLDALLGAAEDGDTKARKQFLRLLTTKFTGFFRHPAHFTIAAEHALRVAGRHGQARLWSAAAATGEEPYSLAMALIEVFHRDDPPVNILATDIDADALAVALRGEYPDTARQSLTAERRERFLGEVHGVCLGSIAPALRRLVEFRTMNLAEATWPIEGPFDVIFCRNVLMYLEEGCRDGIVVRLGSLIYPDGLLMLDPVEHLGKAGHGFAPVSAGVYRRRPASAPRHVVPGGTGIS